MMTLAAPLLAFMIQLPAAPPAPSAAQAAPARPAAADADLDKLRQRLYRDTFTMPPLDESGTKFRVSIEGWQRPAKDLWTEKTTVPAYVRPTMPIEHHEFLMKVTPEEVRSATVHPVGIPVFYLGEKLADLIQQAAAERARESARREVQRAFTDLLKKIGGE